jgi:hypothetical protein
VTGSDLLGSAWQRTDIYVRQRADSQYVGTVDSPERGVRPARETDLAMSADGRTILFRHQPWHAKGRPSLEAGVYRYVYGEGVTRLTVPQKRGRRTASKSERGLVFYRRTCLRCT